jgi:uncharacterized protein
MISGMSIEQYILTRLENELPANLYYHGVHHTKDVYNAVQEIAAYMNVLAEDLETLKIAALFHDAGFLIQYKDHEDAGIALVQEILPQYGYKNEQVEKICSLIAATCVPQNPKNVLEEIICDADLDYLGRNDFEPIAKTLFEEFKAYNIIETEEQWNRLQLKFLNSHQYFTPYSQKTRAPKKKEHIYTIEKIVLTYQN